MSLLLPLLLACAPEPATPTARAVPGGVEIQAEIAVDRVSISDGAGVPLASRRLSTPLRQATVPTRWEPGTPLFAELRAGDRVWRVPVEVPDSLGLARVEVQAPLGQGAETVSDGDELRLTRVHGAGVQVGLTLVARAPCVARVRWGEAGEERQEERRLSTIGERAFLSWELPSCPGEACLIRQDVQVELLPLETPDAGPPPEPERTRFSLLAEAIPVAQAQRVLSLGEVVFPADQLGEADLVRPPDRISLPSRWWTTLLTRTGLGFRPRDHTLPWAWQGVMLGNTGVTAINVIVRSRVLGPDGQPDPSFRPRMRDADDGTGTTSVLLRVPAGQRARAALPVFVDEDTLAEGPWRLELQVTPLGSTEPLLRHESPLGVSRGDPLLSAGLGVTLLGAAVGLLWSGRGLGRWLRAARTSELTTIALFGALSFTVSAAGQLVSMGVSTLLGPFSTFLTGILDDALRTALWAALITLLPRPGVVTLALVVGYLLRVLALGSMGPVDLLFLGSHVLWLEGCLWLAGLTRGEGRWREGPRLGRALRLGLGFGVASALSVASGLSMSASFYRLFYASWYALALIALPGFLYSALAAGLATRFADGLRRVEP